MFILVLTAAVLLITYLVKVLRRPPHFPPGPSWYPIVGNVPLLKRLTRKYKGQHVALNELAKKYNTNILGLKLGSDYVIAISSYPVVRTVLASEEYEGRPNNFFLRLRCMGAKRGVTCTDGELWTIQRSFVVRHLRDLGFGKSRMETLIKHEFSVVLGFLNDAESEVRIGRLLSPSVLNVMWAIMTGSRISSYPNLHHILDLFGRRSKAFDMSGGTLSQLPWLRFLAPEKTGYNLLNNINKELKAMLMATIQEHHKNWSEGRDDDLIYAFITEMKKGTDSSFNDDQLVMVCLDLFLAGAETTSNTIDFAILMMLLHPDVQRKAHEHLDARIDKSSDLSYMDRLNLPYIEAILMEVKRYTGVSPITGPRRVIRDTILDGYHIPKEATVLINIYSVHMDKEIWGDPEVFRPERFLDENGKLKYNDKLIPFGLGKRRCLGEVLARTCLFLFFTGIMRNFDISLPPGHKTPTGVPLPGITLSPEEYRVNLKKRC